MLLLVGIALLLLPSDAGFISSHFAADNLKVKCDSLPYRTAFVGTRCYFAVMRQVSYKEASAQCSSGLRAAKVASNLSSEILKTMMVDRSQFHFDASSSDAKHTICYYDSGYKCDGQLSLLGGKCFVRAEKKMNVANAQLYCKRLGMKLPAPENDLDNQIVTAQLGKDPAWVQKNLVVRANKLSWLLEKSYPRFTTCDGTSRKPALYSGANNTGCNGPMAAVIDNTGYWSKSGQEEEMGTICVKNAANEFTRVAPKKEFDEHCAPMHEMDPSTGKCEWAGPAEACAQLIDIWNHTTFVTLENFPSFVYSEVCLKSTQDALDDYAVKVVVRRGCMFTGYANQLTGGADQEEKVVEDVIYGVHNVPNFLTTPRIMNSRPWDTGHMPHSLTRANCFCDPTEATLNGHVPSPPHDRKCIEHHVFNETTQQCEWTLESKYCGELHTLDNRRMKLEMPNWPKNKKYDVDHWNRKNSENFHIQVTHIVVRQHCFATLYWRHFHEYKTLPTVGYGYHKVGTEYDGTPKAVVGTARFVCECIR